MSQISVATELSARVLAQLNKIILGKGLVLRQCLACLIAQGHLLIEDQPGVGKTTLAHALSVVMGLKFQRIQFTSDLLPADLIGVSIFNAAEHVFRFHPGPLFSQVVLADEINRTTPKTQSALLEAMEEQQITVDGQTRALPSPFFVIATQNPAHQIGTFSLPESQLDRFLMRVSIGLPSAQAERALLAGTSRREMLAKLTPCATPEDLLQMQQAAAQVYISEPMLDYVQAILAASRTLPDVAHGLSPRCGIGLLAAARAWAMIDGRDHIRPEDIQMILPSIVGHRLVSITGRNRGEALAQQLIQSVPLI